MVTRGVHGLVNVAIGIGAIGILGINGARIWIQRKHKGQDYCLVPVELAMNSTRCVQLLGGGKMKIKNINLKRAVATETEFKGAVPVKGNTRGAQIYTKSTRSTVDDRWQLQYAIFLVESRQQSWKVWLYPEDGNYAADDLPKEVRER